MAREKIDKIITEVREAYTEKGLGARTDDSDGETVSLVGTLKGIAEKRALCVDEVYALLSSASRCTNNRVSKCIEFRTRDAKGNVTRKRTPLADTFSDIDELLRPQKPVNRLYVVPMNQINNRWTLLKVDLEKRTLVYYRSTARGEEGIVQELQVRAEAVIPSKFILTRGNIELVSKHGDELYTDRRSTRVALDYTIANEKNRLYRWLLTTGTEAIEWLR